MRRGALVIVGLLFGGVSQLDARERPLEDLPKDAWEVGTVWTEPLKGVARDTRRFDPVSGLWFGVLEGAAKSVERTAAFVMSGFEKPPSKTPARSSDESKPGALFRYSF